MFHVYLSYCIVCSLQPCDHLLGKKVDLLALLYVMFSFVFITFTYGVLGQVWFLIVSIPDLCLLSYFYNLRDWFYSLVVNMLTLHTI